MPKKSEVFKTDLTAGKRQTAMWTFSVVVDVDPHNRGSVGSQSKGVCCAADTVPVVSVIECRSCQVKYGRSESEK